ncbi:MAG TPA: hypothetical protein VJC07_03490 [Candidatus Nanoarchaeia archaeon]|nr:hypothetical protein [Candidatus Nanoarchaeia archaeon]
MSLFKRLRWLPILGLLHYSTRKDRQGNHDHNGLIEVGHVLYTTTFTLLSAFYIADGIKTGEWNPIQQYREHQAQQEASEKKSRKYDELKKRLFGNKGLADTNHDGKISFEEAIDAYRKMGLEKRLMPIPEAYVDQNDIEKMEKAVNSYIDK